MDSVTLQCMRTHPIWASCAYSVNNTDRTIRMKDEAVLLSLFGQVELANLQNDV